MRLPTVQGVIDRRILVNYRVDPVVVAKLLPVPFRPQLVNGHSIVGICLIRLKHLRPAFIRAQSASNRKMPRTELPSSGTRTVAPNMEFSSLDEIRIHVLTRSWAAGYFPANIIMPSLKLMRPMTG